MRLRAFYKQTYEDATQNPNAMIKFELDIPQHGNVIRRYSREGIQINDVLVRGVCVVGSKTFDDAPDLPPLRMLTDIAILEPWLEQAPDILLLGTGSAQIMAPIDLQAALLERGIGVEAMDTFAACRCFNVLVAEQRNVLAVLFPSDDSHLGE